MIIVNAVHAGPVVTKPVARGWDMDMEPEVRLTTLSKEVREICACRFVLGRGSCRSGRAKGRIHEFSWGWQRLGEIAPKASSCCQAFARVYGQLDAYNTLRPFNCL